MDGELGRRLDLRDQRADPHLEARLPQDGSQLRDVLQVELVAGVVLGDEQEPARVRTDPLDRRHRRLHRERQELRVQVVEPPGKRLVSTGASLKPELRRSTDE